MKQLLPNINSDPVSMTSREIADLVGKRHDNVKRTIEALVSNGVIKSPQIEEIPTATRPVAVYVFSGDQGKRDSIVVVAQLSPEFTARLVDRWQELESRRVAQLPNFSNPAEAARAWADQVERSQKAELQLEQAKPAVEFARAVVATEDAISVGEAAKVLGTGRSRLFALLRQRQWVTRHNEPYQIRIEQGYMDVKLSRFDHPEQGLKNSVTPLITGKGLAKLRSIMAQIREAERYRVASDGDAA